LTALILKKTYKTPLVMAEAYRPDVLSFLPVPESELSAQPASTSRFSANLSPHSGKNIKRLSAHGCSGTTQDAFFCFFSTYWFKVKLYIVSIISE